MDTGKNSLQNTADIEQRRDLIWIHVTAPTERYVVSQFRPRPTASVPLPFAARSAGYYHLPEGQVDPPLRKDIVQIIWTTHGRGRQDLGDGKLTDVPPEHITVLLPGMLHHLHAGAEGWALHWLTVDGPLAGATAESLGLTAGLLRPAGPAPAALFDQLQAALSDVSHRGEYRASVLAYELFTAAARGQAKDEPDEAVERALQFIDQYWHEPTLSVEQIARALHVHRSALSRRFRTAVGMPPADYIRDVRTQRALSMLEDTKLPIATIATRCGWADANYFARCIRQATGQAPRMFRERRG